MFNCTSQFDVDTKVANDLKHDVCTTSPQHPRVSIVGIDRRSFVDVFSLTLMKSIDFLLDNNSLNIVFWSKTQWCTNVHSTMLKLLILIVTIEN